MTAKLTPVEVVAWLRKQSQAYSDAADLIEAASFPAETGRRDIHPTRLSSHVARNGQAVAYAVKHSQLSAEAIRERLKFRNARAGDLAQRFGVDEAAIWEIVNSPNSGIRMADRGWLKLEGQPNEELLPKP